MSTRDADDWAAGDPAPELRPDFRSQSVLGSVSRIGAVPSSSRYFGKVALLKSYAPGLPRPYEQGTGVFIQPDIMLTAAHVLFSPKFGPGRGNHACRVTVEVPTMHGILATWGSQLTVPRHYAANPARVQLDVGLLRVVHALPVPLWTPAPPTNADLSQQFDVMGFPTENPQLFGASGGIAGTGPGIVYHRADTLGGQSGGPVCRSVGDDALWLHAIHRAGVEATPAQFWPANGAVRVTPALLDWIATETPRLREAPTCGWVPVLE